MKQIWDFRRGTHAALDFRRVAAANPAGRPKSKTLSEALRLALEDVGDQKSDKTNAELIAAAILNKAKRGDVKAFLAIADRAEGKPAQTLAVTKAEQSKEAYEELVRNFLEVYRKVAPKTTRREVIALLAESRSRRESTLTGPNKNWHRRNVSRTKVALPSCYVSEARSDARLFPVGSLESRRLSFSSKASNCRTN